MKFVESLLYAKAHPGMTFANSMCNPWPATGAEIIAQFHKRANERINHAAGEDWRNETTQEEIEMQRDARALHDWLTKRIICRRLTTPSLQKRFGHLLWRDEN